MENHGQQQRPRRVHLVGSIPVASAEASYQLLADALGATLGPVVPDGETAERRDWIVRLIDHLRDHPDLELRTDGSFGDYDDTPVFSVRKGHNFDWVELDYLEMFRASWPVFETMKSRLPADTAFQVGVPGPLDLAMVTFGFDLRRALRNIGPFRDATVREVTLIHDAAPEAVVFQLEIPIAVGAIYRAPAKAAGALSRFLAKETVSTIRRGPVDARYGLHFCNGDMNNQAMVEAETLDPLISLVNAIVREWPDRRSLDFVHLPFGGGAKPAPGDTDYYLPLAKLDIPDSTRLIAGFVHEADDVDTARARLATIESAAGRRVDIGAPCGLGRRSIKQARVNLALSGELAGREG